MRVGVIGAGLMGTTHVRLLSGEVAGADVVAISDAVVSSAERLATSVGVTAVYADALRLIDDPAVECFVNAQYGYDIRCEVVGTDGAAALPSAVSRGFHERFAEAYVRELESFAAGVGTGATAWDGYAASVVCEAAVNSLRTGRPAAIHLPRHATV